MKVIIANQRKFRVASTCGTAASVLQQTGHGIDGHFASVGAKDFPMTIVLSSGAQRGLLRSASRTNQPGVFQMGTHHSEGTDEVLRYDGTTGAFLDVFASGGGIDESEGLGFGPDGNLYVVSEGTDEVFRYNGVTGAFIDIFVKKGRGGLGEPTFMLFGPPACDDDSDDDDD